MQKKKLKANAKNLMRRTSPAPLPPFNTDSPPSQSLPSHVPREDAPAFIEGERPRRGRPPSPVKKKGVMMYVPEDVHEDFRLCAQLIARRPMNDILEEFMRKYVAANESAIAAVRRGLKKSRLLGAVEVPGPKGQ
jgi:hypothetical protein